MVKIARLPNEHIAVADLDPSDERLSLVLPRDTDSGNRPPALSKSAGPRSTGVEAMKMRAGYLILAIALLCVLALPATALAKDKEGAGKIDASVTAVLEATRGDDAVPVIIYMDPEAATPVSDAVPLGVEMTALPAFDAVAAYLTSGEIDAVSAEAGVEMIVADNPVFGFDYESSMDITNLAIGLADVASPADGGPDGSGVGVAVIDSGVATTSDLSSSRIVGWKDFVNNQKTPYDDAGHGTFVAGLIAGDGTASLPLEDGGYATMQFRGVAPAADIIGVKVLDQSGTGRASAVMAGILWSVANKARYGIDVINLSLGSNPVSPVEYDPIARAVELAWKNGITVVCAAGNEGEFGPGGILSPGNSPYVITVGATDTRQTPALDDDAVTYYSSQGPTLWNEFAKPDVVAPGNRLISLRMPGSYIDTNFPQNLIPVPSYAPTDPDQEPDYLMLSGTSTSAPVTAGAVALLLGEDPSLSPDDVKVRLMATADPLPGATRFQQGAGLIDVDGALADDSLAQGYALSEDVGDGTTVLNEDDYAAWDRTVWTKYGWTKFRWTKFRWTKFRWTKFRWTDVDGTKFRWTDIDWTKFRWTDIDWTKFRWTDLGWTKFRWTDLGWTKFRWTSDYQSTKFRWTEFDWTKFRWTILIEGQ
jgi:serine protease AprX